MYIDSADSASNLQEICKQFSPDPFTRLGIRERRKPLPDSDRGGTAMQRDPATSARRRRRVVVGCSSWSLPVTEGAHQGVLAWRSAQAWLEQLRELLEAPAGVKLCAGKIKADTVMLVAREDASTADSSSGRGVSTSHQTVAKRLGMSSRHVGTARRLIEALGMAVTIVRGRHLSPQERSAARAAHGGYQEAAPSVRALTQPAPTTDARRTPQGAAEGTFQPEAVDTFHLPRRGSVSRSPHLQKLSPTRVATREKAATRPKPKKRSTSRPDKAPRRIELQRFAFQIAYRFLLADTPLPRLGADSRPVAPIEPGVLRGRFHIGRLCNILERYRITPDRYTPQTLSEALTALIKTRKIPLLSRDETIDPFKFFAWQLKRLDEVTDGETTLERSRREAAERRAMNWPVPAPLDPALEEERAAAAAAFFAEARRTRRPTPTKARADIAELITATIGAGTALYNSPTDVQLLTGALTRLHRSLVDAGWTLHAAPHDLRWSRDLDELHITVDDTNTSIQVTGTTAADDLVSTHLDAFMPCMTERKHACCLDRRNETMQACLHDDLP